MLPEDSNLEAFGMIKQNVPPLVGLLVQGTRGILANPRRQRDCLAKPKSNESLVEHFLTNTMARNVRNAQEGSSWEDKNNKGEMLQHDFCNVNSVTHQF